MQFRPVSNEERKKLVEALRGNAEENLAILMDKRDTTFAGSSSEMSDDEVISAIQSVPCHYADRSAEPIAVPLRMASEIMLQKFIVAFEQEVSHDEFAISRNNVELHAKQDFVTRNFIFRFRAFLASKVHPPVVLERSVHRYPVDWWQAFKDRWFPAWWLRRWPAKFAEIEVSRTEQVVKVCPHLKMPVDSHRMHFSFLNDSYADNASEYELSRIKQFMYAMTREPTSFRLSPDLVEEIKAFLKVK